jgi:hypothetical protein
MTATRTADADERGFFGQPVGNERFIEGVEMFHRVRTAEGVADLDVNMVKAVGQKLRRGATVGKGIGKFHAPRPRFAGQRHLGFHHPRRTAIHFEIVPDKTMPLVQRFAGKTERGLSRRRIGNNLTTAQNENCQGQPAKPPGQL